MKNLIKILVTAAAAITLVGCSTAGLDHNVAAIDWSKGSIVLMTVSMTNEYRTNYPPTRLGVVLGKMTDSSSQVLMSSPVMVGTSTSLISQQIAPGYYVVNDLVGQAGTFPIKGTLSFTVDAPFAVSPKTVVYLGHLTLVNKRRVDSDDQATGDAVPLLDQAVTGFSGGTLEVTLQDNFDQDLKEFRMEYPALRGVQVMRSPIRKLTVTRATGSNSPAVVVYRQGVDTSETHSVAVDDVDAVPKLSKIGKAAYRQWLSEPSPRAFVIGADSQFAFAWGGHRNRGNSGVDPLDRALASCKHKSGVDCKPYAINDTVVWGVGGN